MQESVQRKSFSTDFNSDSNRQKCKIGHNVGTTKIYFSGEKDRSRPHHKPSKSEQELEDGAWMGEESLQCSKKMSVTWQQHCSVHHRGRH